MVYFVLPLGEKVDEIFLKIRTSGFGVWSDEHVITFWKIQIFFCHIVRLTPELPPLCAYLHFEQDIIHLCNVHGVLTAASWLQICGCISAVHTMNFTVKLDFLQIDWPLANKAWNTQLYLNVNKWGLVCF